MANPIKKCAFFLKTRLNSSTSLKEFKHFPWDNIPKLPHQGWGGNGEKGMGVWWNEGKEKESWQ